MSAKDSISIDQDSSFFEEPSPLINSSQELINGHLNEDALYDTIIANTEQYSDSKVYYEAVNQSANADWILGYLLLAIAVIAFVKAFQPKRVHLLTATLTNWKIGKQIIRYEKVHSHPVNIGLSFVFVSASSLFIAMCLEEFSSIDYSLLHLWIGSMLILSGFSLVKTIIYKLSAMLLMEEETFSEFSFHTLLFAKVLGVVCLLGVALFQYSDLPKPTTAFLTLSLSVILFLFQLIRGVQIGRQKTQNLLSIILYLCTLEILPLIVLSKWVIGELSRA